MHSADMMAACLLFGLLFLIALTLSILALIPVSRGNSRQDPKPCEKTASSQIPHAAAVAPGEAHAFSLHFSDPCAFRSGAVDRLCNPGRKLRNDGRCKHDGRLDDGCLHAVRPVAPDRLGPVDFCSHQVPAQRTKPQALKTWLRM